MKTADAKVRENLKAIREQLSDKRTERTTLRKERDAAKEAFPEVGEGTSVSDLQDTPAFKDAMEATRKLGTVDDAIATLEMNETGILEMLGSNDNGEYAREGGNRAAGGGGDEPQRGWDGHSLLQGSDDYRSAREGGLFQSRNKFGTINLGEVASRENFLAALPAAPAGSVGSTAGLVAPDIRGFVQPPLKRLSLLDLIPSGTTDSNVVEYVQVTAIPGSAAETAEGELKPQAGLTTIDATAPVRTIPTWIKLNRQALDDVAGLGTLINTLLPYDVRRRLEAQILAGDGTGQNLTGILHTTGVGAPDAVAGDNVADAILRAMTTIILSDQDPNFVTINPLTWQNLLLTREGSNDQTSGNANAWRGEYLYGSPGVLQGPTIWGLSITTNRIVPQGHPLVGDAMAATLLVREGVSIRTSDADQDDFIRNRVTLLAEARAAFAVWRPSGFAIAAQG